jgi:stearoyl-CoA desaturase (delta-9 desaturase)
LAALPREARINWLGSVPFFAMHLTPLGILWTGMTWGDALLCFGLYYGRMFFITAGYHRYFAHRSYKLGRMMQFLMAFGGATAAQKGALWWAGYHRLHHKYSDTEHDVHSPKKGFLWSHVAWIVSGRYERVPVEVIKDFAKYPELLWLGRYHLVPPIALGALCFFLGGPSALFGGFFLSTVLLYHGTFTINSLAHVIGRRRFATPDTSKNSMVLALITMGEGWHNNHHHYCSSVNQGFYWYEVDLSYYVLKLMSFVGLAKDLRKPPEHVLERDRLRPGLPERLSLGES